MFTNSIHWDDISNPRQARKLREYLIKEVSSRSPYGPVQTAIIMSEPRDESTENLSGFMPAGPAEDNSFSSARIRDAKVFRVKFLKSDNKRKSASEAIPDFEALSLTNDVFIARNKVVNLPICVAIGDLATGLKVGDRIKVQTQQSTVDPDVPSLQFCSMVKLEYSSLMSDDGMQKDTIARKYEFLFEGMQTTLEDMNIGSEERSNAPVVSNRIRISWNEAIEISQIPAFKKLGKWVKAAEGNYESVIGHLTGWTDPTTGKRVDQMTLSEIRTSQNRGGSIDTIPGVTSDAVGAYQWIGPTFKETVDYFKKTSPGIDFDSITFGGRTQEALAVYLVFVKRPIVGNYLLGAHDNHTEAGQAMAYEWASIPLQYAVKSPLASCNKIVQKGQSAYEGCAGNKSSSRPNHGPDDLVALLKESQQSFLGSSAATGVRLNNDITVVAEMVPTTDGGYTEEEEEELDEMLAQLGF